MTKSYFDFDPEELDQPIQELTDEEDDALMSHLEDMCGC